MCIRDRYCRQSILMAADEKMYDTRMLLRAGVDMDDVPNRAARTIQCCFRSNVARFELRWRVLHLSLIHISEPTRLLSISYAVFCLKKKKPRNNSASCMT
eukprot:TRINITY_DN56618_c0_g1_i1.p1 TRINITY_DN56618_c0_g1~~TRINITY_DN56618_c0_g1_i1.p1  ORF type:complete len:100 (-),score=19.45 TRINITY_DN56618_c0_g1_i1:45-344(-)